MSVLIEMSLEHFNGFMDKCDHSCLEYRILITAVVIRRPKADDFERIVQIRCDLERAKSLLDLATQIYPAALPDIEKAIAAPRDSQIHTLYLRGERTGAAIKVPFQSALSQASNLFSPNLPRLFVIPQPNRIPQAFNSDNNVDLWALVVSDTELTVSLTSNFASGTPFPIFGHT